MTLDTAPQTVPYIGRGDAMQTIIKTVYVPVADGPKPRPQRLTSVYEFHCPACGKLSEHASLAVVRCPSCQRWWGRVQWQQPVIEDERPAACANPECPHG